MKPIPLQDLPLWSAWPARLLGLAGWNTVVRTLDKIDREYDQDKYAKCLKFYSLDPRRNTPEEVMQFELGMPQDQRMCVSLGNDLFEMTLSEVRDRYYQLLLSNLKILAATSRTIVELGCGYGFNLWYLQSHLTDYAYAGGEYSRNAVDLAGRLYRDNTRLKVARFNYYEPESWRFLEKLEPPLFVFTSHSIEQLPKAAAFVENIARYRGVIRGVCHFEPVQELYEDHLLGLLQRAYTHANNYNNDLYSMLQDDSRVKIELVHPNVLGMNPLNPTSVIHWTFA
jgi:hypothetical protein